MKIKVDTLLLVILPLSDYILSKEKQIIFYTLLLVLALYGRGLKIQKGLLNNLVFIIIPIVWAIIISNNFLDRDFIRSFFYLIQPIVLIALGSLIRINNIKKFLIYYGTISVFLYIFFSILNHNFFNLLNPLEARTTFYFPRTIFPILAIYYLLITKNINYRKLFFFINLYGLVISGSRTYLLIFLLFIGLYFFRLASKKLIVFFFLILLIFTSSTILSIVQGFTSELVFSTENTVDDIGVKYRGFESLAAINHIQNGTFTNKMIGFGLNENIDLGQQIDLGGFIMREIPLLHNGFLYIILRTGFVGLFFYLIFFYRIKQNIQKNQKMFYYILVFALFISNFVVGSFFNIEFAFIWFMIGLIFNPFGHEAFTYKYSN